MHILILYIYLYPYAYSHTHMFTGLLEPGTGSDGRSPCIRRALSPCQRILCDPANHLTEEPCPNQESGGDPGGCGESHTPVLILRLDYPHHGHSGE
ncbi:hypothetical protein EON63_18740, partial [archaeon]